jgi:hypothetical protein
MASVLDYWRTIEIFSPPSIQKLSQSHSIDDPNNVYEPKSNDKFLDKPRGKYTLKGKVRIYQYQIYCGMFNYGKLLKKLQEKVGEEEQTIDPRSEAEVCCLFAFNADEQGQPISDTFRLSTCSWASGIVIKQEIKAFANSNWTDGFEPFNNEMREEFERFRRKNDFVIVDYDYVINLTKLIAEKVGIEELIDDPETKNKIRINMFVSAIIPIPPDNKTATTRDSHDEASNFDNGTSPQIANNRQNNSDELKTKEVQDNHESNSEKENKQEVKDDKRNLKSEEGVSDFLGSFFYKDLKLVAQECEQGNVGEGLKEYLSYGENNSNRINVRDSIGIVCERLSPSLFPHGRWPSVGRHPLVFSQQFAVNSIFDKLSVLGGLFSVNGPPGTGKSTLLRDVIAGIIVNRAIRLSELGDSEAFTGDGICYESLAVTQNNNQLNRNIHSLRSELTGFEIVIASSNNGAVENITQEIPNEEQIDASWCNYVDYFREFGNRIISNKKKVKKKLVHETPNLHFQYAEEEYKGNEEPTRKAWALLSAKLGNKTNRNDFVSSILFGENGKNGLRKKSLQDYIKDNGKSKDNQNEGDEQDCWEIAINRFIEALNKEQKERKKYESFEKYPQKIAEHKNAELKMKESEKKYENAKKLYESKRQKCLNQRKYPPNFLSILFTFGLSHKRWAMRVAKSDNEVNECVGVMERENKLHISNQNNADRLKKELDELMEEIGVPLNEIIHDLGDNIPDAIKWKDEKTETSRELSSPWESKDRAWNNARAELFLEALELHKAFILRNASRFSDNLSAMIDVLKGDLPANVTAEDVISIWQSFFLVIPVVSTTFASFSNMFNRFGKESIGWLLIDEAGQATPQAAVGAIWRAKRSVVVGDPLQLPPVITIPRAIQDVLLTPYRTSIDERWIPCELSTQKLADFANKYGTYIESSDTSNRIWLGAPLRVHRRCEFPMFDISNKIAYNGMMIRDVNIKEIDLCKSAWIDVAGGENVEHWIKTEGERLKILFDYLLKHHINLSSQVFLISPFSSVAKELNKIAIERRMGGAGNKRSGTIHTAQGKESDVVILVLGGDPKKPRARQWASSTPNLLNVAVSRAKRRLYIIGNYDLWSKESYFGECALMLDRIA